MEGNDDIHEKNGDNFAHMADDDDDYKADVAVANTYVVDSVGSSVPLRL